MTIEQSPWRAERAPSFTTSAVPRNVDVAIIGGGITGLTAALLLKEAGKRVAVFERERIGRGETGNTSAHLTYVTDFRLPELAKRFGKDEARRVWEGGAAAIDLIESQVERRGIACGFRRVPGFLCSPFADEADETLGKDAELATELGFAARYHVRGPITGKPAVSFSDQAVFDPQAYLSGLARAVDGDGSVVVEHHEVGGTIDDPLAVIVNGETITCGTLIIATHVPLTGNTGTLSASLFQTKLYPYSSYVLGGRVDDTVAIGLYSDTADPYYYLRVHEDAEGRYAIFGGEDHKTGQTAETESSFARLESMFHRLVPSVVIDRRWTGQVIETSDGLPFIGKTAEGQYVATGYAGNGLTFGTLAGMVLHDAVMKRENPWRELFDPQRKATSVGSLATFIGENIDYPRYMIGDRLKRDARRPEDVKAGEGAVLRLDGARVACHRRDDGSLVKVSAVCTHLGCLVRWNDADRTWDCPCHGSRFTPDGLVLGGPAETPLERVDG